MHWLDSEVSPLLSLECFRLLNAKYWSSLWFIFRGTALIASFFCCSALIQFVFDDAHQAIAAVPTALNFSMGVLIIDFRPVFVDSVWSTMEKHWIPRWTWSSIFQTWTARVFVSAAFNQDVITQGAMSLDCLPMKCWSLFVNLGPSSGYCRNSSTTT